MKILFVLFVTITCARAQDSLQNYCAPRWKVDRLIKIAVKANECDNLVNSQAKLIQDGLRHEIAADSINKVQLSRIEEFEKHILDQDTVAMDLRKLIVIEKKKARPWKVTAVLLGIAEVIHIVTKL